MTGNLTITGRYYRFGGALPNGEEEEVLELCPPETALLIVDAYGLTENDDMFDSAQYGGFYAPDEEALRIKLDRILPVKQAARRVGIATVYVTNALSPGMSESNEWRKLSIRAVGVDVLDAWREPAPVLAYTDALVPDEHDLVVKKQFYSGFFDTPLDSALRNRHIKNVVMVGFDSAICIGATATDAMYRNYRVIVLRDCVRTIEYPETEAGGFANLVAIRYIEHSVGYTSTAESFIAGCDELESPP